MLALARSTSESASRWLVRSTRSWPSQAVKTPASTTMTLRFYSAPKPGSKAFVDAEAGAVIDLFHQFAKDRSSVGWSPALSVEPYLDREGVFELLRSIGERPDDAMVDRLLDAADLDGTGRLGLTEFLRSSDMILGDSPARIVLVVGGPGSGKGTLCRRLEQQCSVVHLSSGDMLRDEVERDTPLGREVASTMEKGELVSSSVMVKLIQRRMRHHPCKRVLLDGFPRSAQNAHDLVELCGTPELALHLHCDDTVLMERIINRNEGRSDDNIQTAIARLRTFHKSHQPTMDWLREQHVPVVNLDCSGTQENVWDQLMAIGRLMRPVTHLQGNNAGVDIHDNKGLSQSPLSWPDEEEELLLQQQQQQQERCSDDDDHDVNHKTAV